MTEPPDTGVRDPAGRSPSHRSWLLPVAILLAIALILGAAVTMRLVDERGDEADEDEAVTVTETQAPAPDEGGDLPAGFVALRSQDNPILPSSNEFTELLRLPLDPGTYLVWGKVGLHNRDPSSSFSASCALVPSNEDGSKRPEGELGSDWAMLHLGPSGQPGEHGEFPLAVTQVLSADGAVVLGCSGYGNTHGAFAQYGSIRALEVESAETHLHS